MTIKSLIIILFVILISNKSLAHDQLVDASLHCRMISVAFMNELTRELINKQNKTSTDDFADALLQITKHTEVVRVNCLEVIADTQ